MDNYPNSNIRCKKEAKILDTLQDAQDNLKRETRIQKTLQLSLLISLILGFTSMGFLSYTHRIGWDFGYGSPFIPLMFFVVAFAAAMGWLSHLSIKLEANKALKRAERAFRDFNLE